MKRANTPIISIVGTSDSGKTTLLEKLIAELTRRGYTVAAIKHDIHGFEMDREGKDSWRLKKAGARAVVVSSPRKFALIEDTDHDHNLEELRDRLRLPVDIILTEGYKREPHPKIEVYRKALGRELLCREGDNLLAVASDVPVDGLSVPCVNINDAKELVDLIEERFLQGAKAR